MAFISNFFTELVSPNLLPFSFSQILMCITQKLFAVAKKQKTNESQKAEINQIIFWKCDLIKCNDCRCFWWKAQVRKPIMYRILTISNHQQMCPMRKQKAYIMLLNTNTAFNKNQTKKKKKFHIYILATEKKEEKKQKRKRDR